jgi:hypothetical protein
MEGKDRLFSANLEQLRREIREGEESGPAEPWHADEFQTGRAVSVSGAESRRRIDVPFRARGRGNPGLDSSKSVLSCRTTYPSRRAASIML